MRLFAESRSFFPDPTKTLEGGLVAVGDDLATEVLLEAYSFGIFPWPQAEDLPIMWFCPGKRGVVDFKDLHVSRSLKKFIRKSDWRLTVNQDFDRVIEECARRPRPFQEGTWITEEMVEAYKDFHRAGYVHSFECWDGDDLVGGLYGVFVGGVFSGESMFFAKPNASKLCFLWMVQVLKQNNVSWMDAQMVTENVEAFGGKYIRRSEFLQRLERSKVSAKKLDLDMSLDSVLASELQF